LKIVLDKGYILTQEKIEIAKNMILKNMDIKTIFEITGLSEEEIEGLK